MDAIGTEIVGDFASHSSWRPTQGGAVGVLLRLRGRALLVRSTTAPAGVYYYWYAPQ